MELNPVGGWSQVVFSRAQFWVRCLGPEGQMLCPALWSQQPYATPQAWGKVAGKLPGGKRPGGVGQ